MNEKYLVLFLYEVSLLKDIEFLYTNEEYQIEYNFNEYILDPIFIEYLNHFISQTYEENKELLSVIFNIQLLEKFIKANYAILEIKLLVKILSKYRGKEKYLHLIETTDKKIDNKLNQLALKFIKYYNEACELSYSKPNPYQKVLQ